MLRLFFFVTFALPKPMKEYQQLQKFSCYVGSCDMYEISFKYNSFINIHSIDNVYQYGGAISIYKNCIIKIHNCLFNDCTSQYSGAAAYICKSTGDLSSAMINDNKIDNADISFCCFQDCYCTNNQRACSVFVISAQALNFTYIFRIFLHKHKHSILHTSVPPDEISTVKIMHHNCDVFFLTEYFSFSQPFSYSESFTISEKFTNSEKFSNSQKFSFSNEFSDTEIFSYTHAFSKSCEFTKSNIFQDSQTFSNSDYFSNSQKFSFSKEFFDTKRFSYTHAFSKSCEFSKSNIFQDSQTFSNSDYFSKSQRFSATIEFSETIQFSKTIEFSESNDFTQSDCFPPSKSFNESSHFTFTNLFTKSKQFSNSKPFTRTNNFTESKTFSASREFTQSNPFTSSHHFHTTMPKNAIISYSLSITNVSYKSVSLSSSYSLSCSLLSTFDPESNTFIDYCTDVYSIVYLPMVFTYLSISYVPFMLIRNSEESKKKITDEKIIGISCGCAAVFFLFAYLALFIYRKKNGLNTNYYYVSDDISYSSESSDAAVCKAETNLTLGLQDNNTNNVSDDWL